MWIVALLPEPWKARIVGLTTPVSDIVAGVVLRVRYVGFDCSVVIGLTAR